MNLKNRFLVPVLVVVGTTFGSLTFLISEASACNSGISRLDPTCRGRIFGPPSGQGTGRGSGESRVPQDQTPPQVRTARNLLRQGYTCVNINEYPSFTCNVPQGMNPSTFSFRSEVFWGNYLGRNNGWAWNCLNTRGQVWGRTDGSLLCQTGMR